MVQEGMKDDWAEKVGGGDEMGQQHDSCTFQGFSVRPEQCPSVQVFKFKDPLYSPCFHEINGEWPSARKADS